MDPRWPLDHIHLVVRDLDISLQFYRDILGFEAKDLGGGVCLSPPMSGRCIIYLDHGALFADKENYIYHLAILVPSRAVLGSILEKILKIWDRIEGYADHLVSEAIYLRDPDNIGVEIYSDRDRKAWVRDEKGFIAMDTLPLDIEDLIIHGRRSGAEPRVTQNTVVGHIHLRGSSPEAAGRFYTEVLGMRITGIWFGARFLAYEDYHHHVAVNNWPIPRPIEGSGLRSFALRRKGLLERVALKEVPREAAELVCEASTVIRDPNGFLVEIME